MIADSQIHFYGAIEKFDSVDDSLLVSGIASSEAVDADGEVITADAMRNALPTYLQKGTVREMHAGIAAGKPISAFVDDDGRTHFTAKIVDKDTIRKIKEGVLKGFSIGGKALKKTGNKIVEILLKDISVVDIPNNPEAFFTLVKFDKPGDRCNDPECKNHHEAAVEKCSECKAKIQKSMKTCKHCDEPIEKCGGKCSGAMAEKKKFDQIDSLSATVDTLVKGFETLKTSLEGLTDLKKVVADVGDLQKRVSEAQAAALATEADGIVTKMQREGRVAFKSDETAYTADELRKLDMNTLKLLAKNSQILPLQARATYTGTGNGPGMAFNGADGKPLDGEALTREVFKAQLGSSLGEMIKNQTSNRI